MNISWIRTGAAQAGRWCVILLVGCGCGGVLRAGVQEDLVGACRAGDVAAARQLLDKGAKANLPDDQGHLPLLFAVFAHDRGSVGLLLQRGADPNREGFCPESDCRGNHPALPLASYLNEPEILQLLLDAKADLGWHDHWATRDANARGFGAAFAVLKKAGGHEWATPPEEVRGGAPLLQAPGAWPPSFESSQLLPAAPDGAAPPPGARPRLAIVAEESMSAQGDLLAAQLSGGDWQLVERQELDRVLGEQRLTGGASSVAARGTALGALLGADAVVLLDVVRFGAQSAAEARVVRVSTGLVLSRMIEPMPMRDAKEWVERAAASIRKGLARARTARAIAISVASLRPSSDRLHAVTFARETELLLKSELEQQPGLAVLERSALEEIARERALGTAGAFWAGSYLADGTAEVSLDEGGTATVTLRLQPMEARAPLSFQAQGLESAKLELVRQVVNRALAALALEPAAPGDLQAEAARQFAQARSAFENHLHEPAYRAVEAAALLGLETPEVTEWRLRIGVALLGTTVMELAKPDFDALLHSGWGEAWVNWKLGGRRWLQPAESLEVARRNLALWHDLVRAAIEVGDLEAAERWSEFGHTYVFSPSLAIWASWHTAAGALAYPNELLAISHTLNDSFQDLIESASAAPRFANLRKTLEGRLLSLEPFAFGSTEALTAEMVRLLERQLGDGGLRARLTVLHRIVDMEMRSSESLDFVSDYHSKNYSATNLFVPTGYAQEVPDRVAVMLAKSDRPEDRLFCQFVRCIQARVEEMAATSDRLFQMWEDESDLLVKEPGAVLLFETMRNTLGRYAHFRRWRVNRKELGVTGCTPEMLAFRRKIFLKVMRGVPQDLRVARMLYDESYHPPDENAGEVELLRSRAFAKEETAASAPPVIARRTPTVQDRPAVPSYAGQEPLPVGIGWSVEEKIPGAPYGFELDLGSLVLDGDRLWGFGQGDWGHPEDHACLVEISLPGFVTRTWPLPKGAVTTKSPAWLVVEPDRISMAKHLDFYAEWDRRSHSWRIFHDLQPASAPVRVGEDFYFLTGHEGESGLVRLDSKTGQAVLLASNRRVPSVTPLDAHGVRALSLSLANGQVVVLVSDALPQVGTAAAGMPPKRWKVLYDPANGKWSEAPEAVPAPTGRRYEYLPLQRPGAAFSALLGEHTQVLQLPFAEMPLAIFKFDFTPMPFLGTWEGPRPEPYTWLWTSEGYVGIGPGLAKRHLWYLPTATLKSYLQAHTPEADEKARTFRGAPARAVEATSGNQEG